MANPSKLTLLVLMVLTVSTHMFAADAKGWYDIGCNSATFHPTYAQNLALCEAVS
jgi:hypothetical protein